MASPVGRLYSAASAGNMDNAIQRKGINSGILSRKPLLDRPVNSKSPSVTGPMNKPASIGKQNISKLSFPSMTKQHSQVHLKEDEEDLNAEQFNFSFEEVEDRLWNDDLDDMVNALEFLKPHICGLDTPPPSPPRDLKVTYIDLDFETGPVREYIWQGEISDACLDVDIPMFNVSDSDYE
ncbi:unnamed protein product [Acanthoscelides obtectus]|uniref:Uncharacterized protein n=1 Tax=Acanthoscelides obtectus TaxID=200917 RepID=A0A9P0JLK9_ACAOB|nr:unnamed protein product [Acanthoscelides obtectus]CAK1642964.1 hypothetical protein AOBTE_LOCUS13323 [Acanthoscelides obtectus]